MKNFNYHFVMGTVGVILMIEALFMLLSALIGEIYHEPSVNSLYLSAAITFVAGGILGLLSLYKRGRKRISKREVYLTVTSVWLLMALFGTLPYLLSNTIPVFSDAYMESMSGFTTTGSTTLVDIESFPKSILFWRSFTQWIGGIGIVVFVLSFLHLYGAGPAHLYSAEATGFSKDQLRQRINETARTVSITYIVLTIAGFLLLWAGPMDAFDAACHSFTSISTGGFSTKQASIAHFGSAYVEYVIIFLMFSGGVRFVLLFLLFRHFSGKIFKDEEFRWYALSTLGFTILITIKLLVDGIHIGNVESTFRTSLFQVTSALTSTGLATIDFVQWGEFYWLIFLSMFLFCGSEGSTSGGMKLSRLIILVKSTRIALLRQVHPKAIYNVKINSQTYSSRIVEKVLAFIFLYLSITGIGAVLLSLNGLTFDESISAALSSMSNYGLALGKLGPSGNFSSLNSFSKYLLSFMMMIGRLEVFTVLSLFFPSFWRK